MGDWREEGRKEEEGNIQEPTSDWQHDAANSVVPGSSTAGNV